MTDRISLQQLRPELDEEELAFILSGLTTQIDLVIKAKRRAYASSDTDAGDNYERQERKILNMINRIKPAIFGRR